MKGKNKKQNLSLLLGIIILFTANSCTKTATEMIVGHWVIEWSDFGYWEADYYDSPDYNEFYDYYYYCQCGEIWEFNANGTVKYEKAGRINHGEYVVDVSRLSISLYDGEGSIVKAFYGIINDMNDNYMDLRLYEHNWYEDEDYYYDYYSNIRFRRTDESISDNGSGGNDSSRSLQFVWNDYYFREGESIICTNDEYGYGELIQHIQIRNNTDETKSIVIEEEVIQDLEGVSSFINPSTVSVPAQSLNSEDLSFHALYEDQIYGSFIVKYYAYEENNPNERISIVVRFNRFSGEIIDGSTISVSGNAWYVLDHLYSDGETIHLEHATFGMFGAASEAGHQQLISGGDGDCLRIGQSGLLSTDYNFLYFNMGSSESLLFYGHATSLDDGYILNNADVVFSPSSIWINGNLITSYNIRHLNMNTNMCLFSNDEDGWDMVQNQTASLGTVTITDAYGNVTAKYIPILDGNGMPCFFNSVSGAYIYHSGSGTPIFHPGSATK